MTAMMIRKIMRTNRNITIMITREEYMAALAVVEAFHRQVEEIISEARNRPNVPIREFVQKVELSPRVRCALDRLMGTGVEISLDEINEFEFLALRNAGRGSWKEFVEKREKFLWEQRQ